MSHGVLPKEVADGTRMGIAPLARRLHAAGVTPNSVTLLGFGITFAGCALLALDRPLAAAIVLLIGTLADSLDGQLARLAGGGTRFGAFLDSTVDRLADAALLGAAASLGAAREDPLLFWSALVGLVASFVVSYTRAKAESLGLTANVGLAPREARLTILLVGAGLWGLTGFEPLFVAAVLGTAILAIVTVLQRVVHVARTSGRGTP
jgi:CDP-diacylglycerol--glycerol-3-phosphate 3-phosphatidyltransferase